MTIVVDTSAILAVLLEEPEKQKIVAATLDCNLIAPPSLHWEIGNALSAMFKKKRLTQKQASHVIHGYVNIPIRFCDVDLNSALEVAEELNIYAYDAYMIECAWSNKAPLLTLDSILKERAKKRKIQVLEVGL